MLEPAVSSRVMQDKKHIHLIGICGTAMASLAGTAAAQGTSRYGFRPGSVSAYVATCSARSAFPSPSPFRPNESPARARSRHRRQRDLAWQCRAGVRARPAHSVHLARALPARGVHLRPRIPCRRRDPRQDHHHQHAGVDLRGRRPARSSSSRRRFLSEA